MFDHDDPILQQVVLCESYYESVLKTSIVCRFVIHVISELYNYRYGWLLLYALHHHDVDPDIYRRGMLAGHQI